ncbi:hypothetical protein MRX96_042845 [Rhipicephalus microplus]
MNYLVAENTNETPIGGKGVSHRGSPGPSHQNNLVGPGALAQETKGGVSSAVGSGKPKTVLLLSWFVLAAWSRRRRGVSHRRSVLENSKQSSSYPGLSWRLGLGDEGGCLIGGWF